MQGKKNQRLRNSPKTIFSLFRLSPPRSRSHLCWWCFISRVGLQSDNLTSFLHSLLDNNCKSNKCWAVLLHRINCSAHCKGKMFNVQPQRETLHIIMSVQVRTYYTNVTRQCHALCTGTMCKHNKKQSVNLAYDKRTLCNCKKASFEFSKMITEGAGQTQIPRRGF